MAHPNDEGRAILLVLASLLALFVIFLPYLPTGGTPAGSDYALHLPNLLAGEYWLRVNGPFAVPWFSPGHCAGVPFLADLNVAYYSFPQWATFVAGPAAAVKATFVVFAALGAAGAYVLLRGPFGASPWASATAAVLFAGCGFFSARLMIGHLTFHPFALAPWLAWAPLSAGRRPGQRLLGVCAAGAALALMFHAGMVHAILPLVVATGAILVLHGQAHGHRLAPWAILALGAMLALGLSAQRLAAATAFLQHFPRDEYALPGFPRFLDEVGVLLRALFWRPPVDAAAPLLANTQFALERHEWDYGLGPAAALLILAGAVRADWTRWRSARGGAAAAALLLALALPLALNWHHPDWHALLKRIPVVGSSSNLLRWYVLYIPLIVVGAALAFDLAVPRAWRGRAAALVAAATVAWIWTDDRSFYRAQDYDLAPIEIGWRMVAAGAPVPAVTHVVVRVDRSNRPLITTDRNNALVRGFSQLLCYQPMFGYGLERLRLDGLRPGPALAESADGRLNMKNPACYLYPAENGCQPGDNFRADQREQAERFLAYRPFEFARPWWQRAADVLNAVALLLTIAALGAAALLAWRRPPSGGAIPGSR